jgi:ABC-type transport system substrate-binding protein
MANYAGNPGKGGVLLVGPEQQTAAGAFQQMLGMTGGNGGLGAGQFLMGGSNVPSLPVASDPVMSALATGGGTDPMAALMGLLGGGGVPAGDPASALMALLGSAGAGAPADAEASAPSNPQVQLEDAVVSALSNPDFARELIRREPAILQKVVKYLSNAGSSIAG